MHIRASGKENKMSKDECEFFYTTNHIYINSISLCVCDEGFGGWGKGEASEATGEKLGQVCL